MGIPLNIIVAYVLGGVTLLPLLVLTVFLHAYFTFPRRTRSSAPSDETRDSLRRLGDDERTLLSEKKASTLVEKFQRNHEPDVAAGYFAVCREYVPGGVNGRPPERTTPAGAVIATESPSVYQSMYRSIFDRKQPPSLDSGKGNGKAVKRARNVFFVVLRHGHLMLYEDSEQVEVKHVISLEHHAVTIYAGGDEIPDGELWIKRNAIQLTRKNTIEEGMSKPFFLFSDNCSDKEDFYFALLQNQEVKGVGDDSPPRPLHFESKDIIGLVQRLHSSEEQLQTRWVNALIGRLFLALYKTAVIEEYIRRKITKKIARVKKPAFLSGIILQDINMGESAPQVTNPRLKDLTIDGDCCVEADFTYNGNFRLEVAATARLDLGARFRAREVNLVLSVIVKKVRGHALLKFKPPPSNRMWVSFEQMPNIELSIEPIVSSRQITYSVILRAIESRIREVIAETIVLPHWDDSPFVDTTHQKFRGGIWAEQRSTSMSVNAHFKIPDESPEDEAEVDLDGTRHAKDERTMSLPTFPDATEEALVSTADSGSPIVLSKEDSEANLSNEQKGDRPPRALRSTSFATAADPLVSNANADFVKREKNRGQKRQKDASSSMKAISNRSRPTSPSENTSTPFRFPQTAPESTRNNSSRSSTISRSSDSADQSLTNTTLTDSPEHTPGPPTPSSASSRSVKSTIDHDSIKAAAVQLRPSTATPPNKKQSMAALGAATAAAKKWGWGVLARNADKNNEHVPLNPDRAGTPANPIGRGHPLPPPGQPLPSPNAPRSKTMPNPSPKRKPLPAPLVTQHQEESGKPRSYPVLPLPARRRQSSTPTKEARDDGLLVVQAPISEPSSPTNGVTENVNDSADADSVNDGKATTNGSSPPSEDASDANTHANNTRLYQPSFPEDQGAPAIGEFV